MYLHNFSAHMLKIVQNWPLFRWVKVNDRASNKMILICLNSDFPQALQPVRSGQQTTTHLPAAQCAPIKLFTAMLERLLIPKENNRWSGNCVLSSETISDVVYCAWKESKLITYSCIATNSETQPLRAPLYFLWPPHKLLTSFQSSPFIYCCSEFKAVFQRWEKFWSINWGDSSGNSCTFCYCLKQLIQRKNDIQ